MAAVIRISGAIAQNPNLLTLAGTDPDKPFGEIWVDFGVTDPGLAEWNKVNVITSTTAGSAVNEGKLKNTGGIETAVAISSETGFRPFSTGSESAVDYPANVGTDGFYLGESSGVTFDESTIYFDGLSKKRLYTLEIFASRLSGSGPSYSRISYYTANGRTGQLDATDNLSTVIRLENVAADESGRIALKIERRSSDFSYISATKIIEQA